MFLLPSILSTLFSLLANISASLSEALFERLKTESPFAFLFLLESACMEIKISALFFFANFVLCLNGK